MIGADVTSVAEAIHSAAARLAVTSDTARLDAELLMAHALGVPRSTLLIHRMGASAPANFDHLVDRRAQHEPVAYIIGTADFFGLEFAVGPGVLIPRADSETLIQAARAGFADRAPPAAILDLGTGSGALLLAAMAQFVSARGCGIDNSPAIVPWFTQNRARHAAQREVRLELANWHQRGWAEDLGTFDLVLCNPPYVEADAGLDRQVREHEPASALFAGREGLDDYRVLIPQLRGLMRPQALAILEIGASQFDAVSALATHAGFAVEICHDLANRPRAVVLR